MTVAGKTKGTPQASPASLRQFPRISSSPVRSDAVDRINPFLEQLLDLDGLERRFEHYVRVEVKQLLHEGDLVDHHAQREFAEIPERAFAEMTAAIVRAGAAAFLVGIG